MKESLPFRLGATSYVIPDDIVPNVRYLAKLVKDIELVLFDLEDGTSNLPDTHDLEEMVTLAQRHGLSYTVHLPLDLRMAEDGSERHISLLKARKVVDCTSQLNPWAYVAHLDGRQVRTQTDKTILEEWNCQSVRALSLVASWLPHGSRLAVENLEGYPLEFWDKVMQRTPFTCCVDIGHLWLDGHDPLPYLQKHIEKSSVLHIHGIHAGHDHRGLENVPPDELVRVLRFLIASGFQGVMSIEVFGKEDFHPSMQSLETALLCLQEE